MIKIVYNIYYPDLATFRGRKGMTLSGSLSAAALAAEVTELDTQRFKSIIVATALDSESHQLCTLLVIVLVTSQRFLCLENVVL